MKISVLCALTLLACISVNQAAVRVVDWPPKTGGRTAQDNVPVRVVKWPSKSNERGSKSSKVLSDPLKWMSDDSKRFFQNTDGLNWVEIQEGKEPNVFTEVSRKGSDDSLVVLLKRSDNLYVKLSEGMAWWSWNMGFPENNKIGEGSWKKVDSTRDAAENGEDEDCDDDQAVRSPYKIINREEPVDEDCDDDQAVRSPYKIINREEPVDEDCDDDQAVREEPVTEGEDCDEQEDGLVQPIRWQNSAREDHYFEQIDDFSWGEFVDGEEVFFFVQVKVLAGSPDEPEEFEVLLRKQDKSYVRLTNQEAWWGPSKNDISVNFAHGFWLTSDPKRNSQLRNLLNESGSHEGDCTSPSINDDKTSAWFGK